jgi:hypothetical protein
MDDEPIGEPPDELTDIEPDLDDTDGIARANTPDLPHWYTTYLDSPQYLTDWPVDDPDPDDELERLHALPPPDPPPVIHLHAASSGPHITAEMYDRLAGDIQRRDLEDAGRIMRSYSAAELLELPRRFDWLARGFANRPTYGMCAGEKKTLKSYVTLFAAVAIAAGRPVFGHFAVDHAAPVIIYVGEGGRIPYTYRLERVADALRIDLRDLPLRCSFESPAIQSPKFRHTLNFDLEHEQPGLVIIDPFYAFHGTSSDARNLHEEGNLLSSISGPCTEANATLQVVNHFKKSGNGTGLDRITMAGGAEWVDSWWLLSHRNSPKVTDGDFELLLEIGSRQWGGTNWDLNLHLGLFNPETGQHEGTITWELAHHQTETREHDDDSRADTILELIAQDPAAYTKSEIIDRVGGHRKAARDTFAKLEDAGDIALTKAAKPDSTGRKRTRTVYVLGSGASVGGPTTSDDWSEYD